MPLIIRFIKTYLNRRHAIYSKMPIGKCVSFYNFKLTHKKNNIPTERKYRMTQEITREWGIPRASIYLLLNKNDKIIKWCDFAIERIHEPACKIIYFN